MRLTSCIVPHLALLLASGLGCGFARYTPISDGFADGAVDGPADGPGPAEARGRDSRTDAKANFKACRAVPLECLDASPDEILEVPSEVSLETALATAKAGDTIQVRGAAVGGNWKVPPYVTLRGCQGAKITAQLRFAGSAGTVEGFEVSGWIMALETGSYVVRYNRFLRDPEDYYPGFKAETNNSYASSSITVLVDGNWFEGRKRGIYAHTEYDTLVREVTITIRNNIFTRVTEPVVISEAGAVGKIKAVIEHNTLRGFQHGIFLESLSVPAILSGVLLLDGETAVRSDSPYELRYSWTWQVKSPYDRAPVSGVFSTGEPALVDAEAGDFHPSAASLLVDSIPAGSPVPDRDYLGCSRPVAFVSGEARADIGAIELRR